VKQTVSSSCLCRIVAWARRGGWSSRMVSWTASWSGPGCKTLSSACRLERWDSSWQVVSPVSLWTSGSSHWRKARVTVSRSPSRWCCLRIYLHCHRPSWPRSFCGPELANNGSSTAQCGIWPLRFVACQSLTYPDNLWFLRWVRLASCPGKAGHWGSYRSQRRTLWNRWSSYQRHCHQIGVFHRGRHQTYAGRDTFIFVFRASGCDRLTPCGW